MFYVFIGIFRVRMLHGSGSCCIETRLMRIYLFRYFQCHRWRKRGLGIVPIKYNIQWRIMNYSVLVSVFNGDGTVAVSHAGIEMGQGINTKVFCCPFVVSVEPLLKFCFTGLRFIPYKMSHAK